MSRHKRRSAARKGGRKAAQPNPPDPTSADQGQPAADGRPMPQSNRPGADPPRPNRWFLAVTALLQVAWIVFLVIMALSG